METKIVEKIQDIDMTGLKMPMFAVYKSPTDYIGKCVARLFDLDKPSNVIILKDSVEDMQQYFAEQTPLYFLKRGAGDIPELVGVWI